MAIKYWLAYLLQQLTAAAAVLCAVLALSEILLPASVLPYFNLHALIIGTFALCLISPAISPTTHLTRATRFALCATLSAILIAYAFLMLWSGGFAADIVFVALVGIVLCVGVALIFPMSFLRRQESTETEILSVKVAGTPSFPLVLKGDVMENVVEEVIIVEDETTSIFMR